MTPVAALTARGTSRGSFARIARGPGLILTLRRERADLSRLDDHRLVDLGLTRAQVREEVARPLWDAPERWKSREWR